MLLQSIAVGAAERAQDYAYGIPIHAEGPGGAPRVRDSRGGVSRSSARRFGRSPSVQRSRRSGAARAATAYISGRGRCRQCRYFPVFPFYRQIGGKGDDSNVRVEKRRDGTIVSIQSGIESNAPGRRLQGYLIDASALKQPIKALRLNWRSNAEGFVGKVSISGSDDFSAWITLVDHGALVHLTFDGQQLNQNRVELPSARYKFLRVTWPNQQMPLEALAVVAEPTGHAVGVRRVWQTVAGSILPAKANEYVYGAWRCFSFRSFAC